MALDFEGELADPERGLVVDRDADAAVALVAFGGISGGLAMPPFEFFTLAKGIPATKIFIRDLDQAWYQRGVRGLGSSITAATDGLRSLLAEVGADRVVGFGNSAGGFGAILFGHLVGFDEVHAFAPQTFIDRARRIRYRDRRWPQPIHDLRAHPPAEQVYDVQPLCLGPSGPAVHVYVAADTRLDEVHAERLRSGERVVMHHYESGGHGVIRELRDSNELDRIIRTALAGTDDQDGHA